MTGTAIGIETETEAAAEIGSRTTRIENDTKTVRESGTGTGIWIGKGNEIGTEIGSTRKAEGAAAAEVGGETGTIANTASAATNTIAMTIGIETGTEGMIRRMERITTRRRRRRRKRTGTGTGKKMLQKTVLRLRRIHVPEGHHIGTKRRVWSAKQSGNERRKDGVNVDHLKTALYGSLSYTSRFFIFIFWWRWESGWLLHVDALAVTMVTGFESAWLAIYVRVFRATYGIPRWSKS